MKLTDRKECTDWFRNSKYGVFFHFLFSMDEMKNFDADGFAKDVNEMGAGFVILTLGQNSGFYCGPNPTYEKLTQNAPGTKCYTDDIPMQAAKALDKYGIKLMLYLPSHPPSRDNEASIHLGVNQQIRNDWVMNDTSVKNWCSIIKDWSEHYGKNIYGWWFDGFYPWIGLDEHYAEFYKKAVLSGNDTSILALNQGLEPTIYPANKYCDYTAGEFNEYGAVPEARFVDGAQWHIGSFIGKNWTDGSVCVDKDFFADYINRINSKGGVASVGLYIDSYGRASREQLEFMRYIKQKVKG